MLISCAVTAQLICDFDFAKAKVHFSEAAHIHVGATRWYWVVDKDQAVQPTHMNFRMKNILKYSYTKWLLMRHPTFMENWGKNFLEILPNGDI